MDKQEGMYTTLIQDDSSAEAPTHNLNIKANNYLSMYTRREVNKARRYRLTTGSLGFLCAILMIAIITLCVHYKGAVLASAELEDLRTNHSNLGAVMEKLEADYRMSLREKADGNRQRDVLKTQTEQLLKQKEDLLKQNKNLESRLIDQEGSRRKSWVDARADCIDRGADLVVVDSKEKQMYLSRVLQVVDLRKQSVPGHLTGFWVGLRDIQTEGVWKWLNGTDLVEGYWMEGEPNDHHSVEDCVATYQRSNPFKSWNDAPCGTLLYWICEL